MKKLTTLLLCLALVCALAVPALADMQKGSKGDDVKELQQRLIDLGYLTGSADGDFGGKTETALKAFQAANGLEETGIATDADTAALYADTAIDSQGNPAAPAAEEPAAEEPAAEEPAAEEPAAEEPAAEEPAAEETPAEGEAEATEAEPAEEPAPATPFRTTARDKLTIWGETFMACPTTYEGGNDYVYAFARVENTSDKEVTITNPLFEIYDANDDLIKSEEYLTCEPSVLQPGEYAYLCKSMYLDDGIKAADVADHVMDVNIKNDSYCTYTRYPVTVEYVEKDPNNGDRPMIYATITNDTEETVYNMRIIAALTNDIGEVVYVTNSSTNLGLVPGAAVVFPLYVDNIVLNYMETNGITATGCDAIAYTQNY